MNPATRLVFGKHSGLFVSEGSLFALGSADNPVVFTGLEATPGYWQGITLDSDAKFTLRNAIIEYGGSAGTAEAGNVMLMGYPDEWGYLLMENCILRHSAAYGLVIGEGVLNSDYATVNTFEDNALGDTYDIPPEDDEEDW